MVSVLASNVVDRGFQPRSVQTQDYTIGMCCFSVKRTTLRKTRATTDSESGFYVPVERHAYHRIVVLGSWHYTNSTSDLGVVQSGHHRHLIAHIQQTLSISFGTNLISTSDLILLRRQPRQRNIQHITGADPGYKVRGEAHLK